MSSTSPSPGASAATGAAARSSAARARRALIVVAIAAPAIAALMSKVKLCPVAAVTHHPCAGCGLTRATLWALRGELAEAAALQPFAFLVTPLLAAGVFSAATNYVWSGRALMASWLSPVFYRAFTVLFLVMIVFWVARFFGFYGGPVPV